VNGLADSYPLLYSLVWKAKPTLRPAETRSFLRISKRKKRLKASLVSPFDFLHSSALLVATLAFFLFLCCSTGRLVISYERFLILRNPSGDFSGSARLALLYLRARARADCGDPSLWVESAITRVSPQFRNPLLPYTTAQE
jgi:hypothetical protein